MNNLEWLYKYDDEFAVDVQKCVKSCDDKPRWMTKDMWLMAEHETNGIDGETNGINADAPLADPVEIMRKVANGDEVTGNAMRKEVGGTDWSDALLILADMIERDYVRRGDYDFVVEMLNCMKAERDELKAFSERLETAAHDKLGVTLFGVDYVTEEFMLHVRDTLTAERDEALEIRDNALGDAVTLKYERDELTDKIGEITDEVSELVNKQPYTFNVHDAPGSLRTVGRYIDELTAERDEWKAKAEQAQESYLDAKSDRDAWMAKYKQAELRSDDGVTNIEWLYEHDRERILRNLTMEDDPCLICPEFSGGDELCMFDGGCSKVLREWLMAPHANDDLPPKNDVSADAVDANDANADEPDTIRNELVDNGLLEQEVDSREKLEADAREWCSCHLIRYENTMKHVIGWLDRQAAITERKHLELACAFQLESDKRITDMQKKVDALTQANGDLRDEWHRVCRERDELRRELTKSNREREQLRKSLGIAIDHAHDMIALVSVDTDEGAE